MFWSKRKQSDFNAEVEAHIALEADRLKEQGLNERTSVSRLAGGLSEPGRAPPDAR